MGTDVENHGDIKIPKKDPEPFGKRCDLETIQPVLRPPPRTVIHQSVVYCTLHIEGTHNWPGCPFDEVAYLRDPHRHMFHIKAYKPVSHSDRDVEFIMLKHQINKHLIGKYWSSWEESEIAAGTGLCEFGAMSCEMIAEELIGEFDLSKCEVSEDGENGAVVTVIELSTPEAILC